MAQPFEPPPNWDQAAAVMSADGRLRLLLDAVTLDSAGEKVTGLVARGFQPGDKISVVVGGLRHPDLELLPISAIATCEDRIFVPSGHLIYSGSHDIEMVLE